MAAEGAGGGGGAMVNDLAGNCSCTSRPSRVVPKRVASTCNCPAALRAEIHAKTRRCRHLVERHATAAAVDGLALDDHGGGIQFIHIDDQRELGSPSPEGIQE